MSAENSKEKLVIEREMICFIGPEGSGKTTQAKMLSKAIGKPYLSIGDVLRNLAENDPGKWGSACRDMFEKSIYLDPKILLQIQKTKFSLDRGLEGGVVVDGLFRTAKETIDFPAMLKEIGKDMPITVIYLKVNEEESFKRLTSNTRGRHDDTVERIKSRLGKFNDRLDERLELMRQNHTLIEIDAAFPPDEVFIKICEALGSR